MDDDIERIRRELYSDRNGLGCGATFVVFAVLITTVAIVAWATQPWPSRLPGGGEGARTWGPGVTALAGIAAGAIVIAIIRWLKARRP